MRALILISLLLALPACKKKSPTAGDDADYTALMAKFSELRTMMCACKVNDKACADKVHESTIAWSKVNAGDGSVITKLSDAQRKTAADLSTEYGNCMTRAYGGAPTPFVASPVEELTNADQILKRTFEQVPAGLVVAELKISYVRSDGTVDPTYGTVEIRFGKAKKPSPADDPSRPLGAPVPVDTSRVDDAMARCPKYSWRGGTRSDSETICFVSGMGITKPRCSVVEVWKRASDAGAPAAGLAVLALRGVGPGSPEQYWDFAIDDGPRNVHFSHSVQDTCEPTLERP
ncbi:MAG: hypothetical protein H0T46_36480 [Deltaproteobacteria bacterium]|nr:hypothetical protein [Deltaproteobacteria bacterium]